MIDNDASAADPFGQIADEFVEAFRQGKRPSVEEFARRYPEHAAEIRDMLPALELIEQARSTHDSVQPPPTRASAGATPLHQPGDYQILHEIGRGGMGVVYRARDAALDRDVAVKLLSERYPADSSVAQRFLSEARITAQLQHPGIPAVHQVGTLADGRPFLAMKLIKGGTLEALLKQRPDPSAERGRFLAIFEALCQAVAYAHAHHVIHRDLKPANVMVGAFGEVQVMDWGLAKVLGEQTPATAEALAAEQTRVGTVIHPTPQVGAETQAGSLVGTPAFIAPEQAVGQIERVNERSDVFGLGAVLAVILTGKPPYVGDSFESVRVQAVYGKLEDCFARLDACGAEPELVALCKQCLAFEPAGRPADAGAVAQAVAGLRAAADERARQAELDRVQAEGEAREALARAAEQQRRRRMLLMASGIIALVLLTGLSASLWQMRRAMQAEAQANTNADQAREEANARALALAAEQLARQQAFAALRSMTEEVVERKFAQGAVLTQDDRAFLRGIIAQFDAFAAIKGDDADSRALRAEGRWRVGTMRHRLGELEQAQKDYDQALSLYQQLSADFPSRTDFQQQLAGSHNNRGNLLSDTGRPREAENDYNLALSIRQQLAASFPTRPDFRQDLALSHSNRGRLLYTTGRLEEAEKDYDQALSIRKRLATDFPSRTEFRQDLATSHYMRGNLLRATGRLREAQKDYDQALSIYQQLSERFPSRPDFRRDLAGSHNNRGNLLRDTRRLKEAEKDYDEALSIRKQLAADFPTRPEFRQELAASHLNRGVLLRATGRLQDAEREYGQSLAIGKQLAADFPSRREFRQDLARSHNNRGDLLRATGRLTQAEKDFDQALSIRKQLAEDFPDQPDLHNDLAGTCVNLALLHRQQGNPAAAKRLLLEGHPHHLAALKAKPRHPAYRQFYRNHLSVLTEVQAGLLEQADAVRTALIRRDLGWNAPADAYDAAWFLSRCIAIVARHDQLDDKQRKEAAQFYADAALKLLRDAVGKGYKDVMRMKKDPALAPLRRREDFKKLLTELEGKG
jgi:serine/threonine protein kinase/predicted RNA polymerase sigma factor